MSAFAKDSDNVEREEPTSSSTSVPCDPSGSGAVILEEEEEEDEDDGEEEASSSIEEPSTSSSSSTRPTSAPHPAQSPSIKPSSNPGGPSFIDKLVSSSMSIPPIVKPRTSKPVHLNSSTSSQTNEASPGPSVSDSNKETESQRSVATYCSSKSNLVPPPVAVNPPTSNSPPVASSRNHKNSSSPCSNPVGDVNRNSPKPSTVVAGGASTSAGVVAEPSSSATETNVHTAKVDKKLAPKESNSKPHIEYVVLI